MVQAQQGEGLDELGLDGGRPDRQDRLPGEDGRPLGDGPDIAGKPEIPQVVQEFLGEESLAPEVLDVLLGEAEVLHIVDELVQPRADGKSAVVRHVPEKDVKIGDAVLIPGLQIAVPHGQLVEVTEKAQVQLFLFHKTPQMLPPGALPGPCSAGGAGAVRPPDSISHYRGRGGEKQGISISFFPPDGTGEKRETPLTFASFRLMMKRLPCGISYRNEV